MACRLDFTIEESVFYRDRLRTARYAALADAEGFAEICFALEALGMRLLGRKETLGQYANCLSKLASLVPLRLELSEILPGFFTSFSALYETLRTARNDVMHSGAYARHATSAAIEICIHLEEAVMAASSKNPKLIKHFMVKQVVSVEDWQPVAYARELMLTHSFSFLPSFIGNKWHLISDFSVAAFLSSSADSDDRKKRLSSSILEARTKGLHVIDADVRRANEDVSILLSATTAAPANQKIWLVADESKPDRLLGILTPFELM
jgi:hypothetical protein